MSKNDFVFLCSEKPVSLFPAERRECCIGFRFYHLAAGRRVRGVYGQIKRVSPKCKTVILVILALTSDLAVARCRPGVTHGTAGNEAARFVLCTC